MGGNMRRTFSELGRPRSLNVFWKRDSELNDGDWQSEFDGYLLLNRDDLVPGVVNKIKDPSEYNNFVNWSLD